SVAFSLATVLACCSRPAAAPAPQPAEAHETTAATAQSAIAVITALYQPYLAHHGEPPAWYAALPMTPELAALVARDQHNANNGDEGAVEADPIIAAQDFQLSELTVTAAAAPANGRVVVTARFKNITSMTDVRYDMVERASDHAWLVD